MGNGINEFIRTEECTQKRYLNYKFGLELRNISGCNVFTGVM